MSESMHLRSPGSTPALPETGLTHQQRHSLVQSLQNQALQRPDPLAANLGVLTGDVMALAHGMATSMPAALLQPPASSEAEHRQWARLELYLKVLRQADRLMQMERQLSPAVRGAPGYR